MKISHCGDIHLEEDRYFDDTAQCLEWFVEDSIRANTNVFVVDGDLTTYKATIKERNLWVDALVRMANHAPVVLVAGNHGAELEETCTSMPVLGESTPYIFALSPNSLSWVRPLSQLSHILERQHWRGMTRIYARPSRGSLANSTRALSNDPDPTNFFSGTSVWQEHASAAGSL